MESFQLSQDSFHLFSRQDHWQALGMLRPDELGEIARLLSQDLFVQESLGSELHLDGLPTIRPSDSIQVDVVLRVGSPAAMERSEVAVRV